MRKPPEPLKPDDKRITRQEARDLLTALDKPEFGGLMDGYLKEISEPKNVIESNQYLKETEEKNDLPSNVKLAKPEKGFCIRSEKFSIKHPGQRKKVFINICSLKDVKEPTSNDQHMWSLPYLLNKGRHDQDKKGKVCMTFDVVFNPKAIELSKENIMFKKFVCDTAINGINSQILSKEEEKISSDFVVKKFDYKGLEVAYINVHSLTKGDMDDRKEPSEYHKTEAMREVERIQEENKKKMGLDKEEDIYDQVDVDDKDHVNETLKVQKEMDKDSKTPLYKIKYSDTFEIKNFFYEPSALADDVKYTYKNMIVEINTPLMGGAADANLEVDVKRLKFSYKDIYLLDIDLPMEVNNESVKAKFDKSKKILTLTMEIVHKVQERPKKKEDENIEIVNDEEEERKKKEEERKKKEEAMLKEQEEKKKQEEERLRKAEEERMKQENEKKKQEQERMKLELERKKKAEEEKNNKELLEIKENNDKNEIKFKHEKEEKKEEKKLVEEIKPIKEEEIISKDENKNKKADEDDEEKKELKTSQSEQEDTRTPTCFLTFQNEWVYEIQ